MKSKENISLEENNVALAKKAKRKKITKKVFIILLIIIVSFIAVTTIISAIGLQYNINKAKSFDNANTAELSLDNYENGYWNIYTENDLKIMQLTDVHIGGGWMSIKKDSMAINAVASMITAEKPDFVIVTGDLSYPVPFQAGTFNNKSAAKIFANLMESLGVYWTLSYGNHDTEAYSYFSRESLTKFYSSGDYPHCLLQEGPSDVDGSGNQLFKVVNNDGVVLRSLIIMDSHSYIDGDVFGAAWKYDNIHDNQISWYTSLIEETNEKNKETISALDNEKQEKYSKLSVSTPSTLFLHIPLEEYKTAYEEYKDNGFKDTADVKYNYGVAGETGNIVYCGIHSDNMFETMLAEGSTDSIFCGHDHLNNFSLNYKGINLNYGMSIDYLAYAGISKEGSQRGCTMIDVKDDGSISYNTENYYQDKFPSKYPKENVTMQDEQ